MKFLKIRKIISKSKNITAKSALNAAINKFEFGQQLSNLHSLPQTVDVVLTKECNLRCIFCKNFETLGAKFISIENFEKVAQQLFPTARSVNICSGGEPYLHRQLIDLLRIVKRYKVATFVLSNGMLLHEKIVRTIIKEELISKHGFSVDGIKASTVESIRVNAKLDVIIKNIQMLIRIREEECKQRPRIVIRYTLMYSNIEELPDAVRYWGDMGIDILDCAYLSICNKIDDQESLYFHQDLMEQVFSYAREVASYYPHLILNLPPTISEELPKQYAHVKCSLPWRFVMINTDGRILPCYKSWGIINMGKIYGEDSKLFKDVWNSSQYQSLRHTNNNDAIQKYYSYCSICQIRLGIGNKAAHLEDETWLDHILDTSERSRVMANRSRN
jgi:radical SAM protein with 4Fe4S-binding SPASM domain